MNHLLLEHQLRALAGVPNIPAEFRRITTAGNCPTALSEGAFYNIYRKTFGFVAIPEGEVHEISSDGTVHKVHTLGEGRRIGVAVIIRGTNGQRLFVLSDGGSFILDLDTGKFKPTRSKFPLDLSLEGLGRPNDTKVDPHGRLVGSLIPNTCKDPIGQFFHYDGLLNSAKTILSGVRVPNGICFSPDNRLLYLTDSTCGVQHVLEQRDKSFSRPSTLADLTALLQFPLALIDGATVTADGTLILTAWGLRRLLVVSPAGKLIGEIEVPVPRPTSVEFGGDDMKTVIVTSERCEGDPEVSGSVFTAKLDFAGRHCHELVLR